MRPSLGCYKGLDYPGPADEPTVTPNLDGLAREGTLFANAYVQQPFCAFLQKNNCCQSRFAQIREFLMITSELRGKLFDHFVHMTSITFKDTNL